MFTALMESALFTFMPWSLTYGSKASFIADWLSKEDHREIVLSILDDINFHLFTVNSYNKTRFL